MWITDALSFLKTYGEGHSKSFIGFFRRSNYAPSASDLIFEHVSAGALIYLAIGVALLGSFHRGMSFSEIPWLDVALLETIFWISIAIVLWLLIRVTGEASASRAFLVTFRVMPVAFVCGAFASALGYALSQCLRALNFEINTLPHLFHVFIAFVITFLYMPREIRAHAMKGPTFSRVAAAVISFIYLAVNVVAFVLPHAIRSG